MVCWAKMRGKGSSRGLRVGRAKDRGFRGVNGMGI